jgi:hypothetical protein
MKKTEGRTKSIKADKSRGLTRSRKKRAKRKEIFEMHVLV